MSKETERPRITVIKDGPYVVHGDAKLVGKTQISSEHGEPMTWQTNERIETGDSLPLERCPSGSYTYALDDESPDIEPDLPQQIAVTTEMTLEGPIRGPLWVTGHITIERAGGEPVETRNRMTLCRCGLSENKPLCDGTHRS